MASRHLTCLLIAILQVFSTDAQCVDVIATAAPQNVMSPNYPGMYGTDACNFKISAAAGEVVYIQSKDVDLYKNDGCDDNIKFYNGGSTAGTLLETVCGMDMVMLQSPGQDVYVSFTSDDNRVAKGYVLSYWSAPPFNPVCQEITDIGAVPVFIKFPVPSSPSDCKYTLRAPANHVVSLDLLGWDEPESMKCGVGSIIVTDSTYNVINHCGDDRPFWNIISQGIDLDLTVGTSFTGDSKPFYIKVQRINTVVASCADVQDTRVGPVSTFMWFPLYKAGSMFCSMTLQAPETAVRVGAPRDADTCDGSKLPTFAVQLAEAGVAKTWSCMNENPVYTSSSRDLTLNPSATTNPVFLTVASVEKHCGEGAVPNMLTTPTNESATEIVLEDIQRDSYCTHKIMAASDDERVELILSSTLEDASDCVKVMGAVTRSEPMMAMYCGKFDPVVFTSTGRELSFTVITNSMKTEGKIHIKYFSIQQFMLCNRHEELLATRTKMTLMTPNYPYGYPLNAVCSWRFVSYRSDFVVVVEVEESDLPENCDDMGYVNDGELDTNTRLGEWCGQRTPQYRGTGQTLLVTFNADHLHTMHKGIKFTYYADNKVHRDIVAGTDVMTIAAVFTIITVAGGLIFIVWRLCTRNKAKRAARKADRQPIT